MMFINKTVWITGASSGIGEALVLNLAKQGAKLIISSRREDVLLKIKEKCGDNKKNITVQTLDLANPASIIAAADAVLKQIDKLDYVFLNGGISQRSLTQETEIETDRKLMEVNYFGTIGLTKKILPFFIKQGFGHFVVTSSISGVFGFPLRSAYSAAKHALHGYFDSLRAEHVVNNINVTIACPGRIKTNISVNAIGPDGKPTGTMDNAQNTGMTAEKCANQMIKAAAKNKKEVYIGKKEILMVYFKRYIPALYYKLASSVKRN